MISRVPWKSRNLFFPGFFLHSKVFCLAARNGWHLAAAAPWPQLLEASPSPVLHSCQKAGQVPQLLMVKALSSSTFYQLWAMHYGLHQGHQLRKSKAHPLFNKLKDVTSDIRKKFFFVVSGEALKQVAQRSCGCPMPGSSKARLDESWTNLI